MIGSLSIQQQHFPDHRGHRPLSYAVYLSTDEQVDGIDHWQSKETARYFVCYAFNHQNAQWAVGELRRYLTPLPYTPLQLTSSVRFTHWMYVKGKASWWRRALRRLRGIW
jgi:hypothetical protein